MKNKLIITALSCCICLLTACGGDRVPQTGKDTVTNTYGTAKDTAKLDTGMATGLDNSGSGGTKTDSVKKDNIKK